jgi:hypothetical protein
MTVSILTGGGGGCSVVVSIVVSVVVAVAVVVSVIVKFTVMAARAGGSTSVIL